jgi:hypothetical protein
MIQRRREEILTMNCRDVIYEGKNSLRVDSHGGLL